MSKKLSLAQLFRRKPIPQIMKDSDKQASSLHGGHLRRTLGVVDLTAMGIAAVIGAGIFSTIGNAAFDGGPGVVLLFVFTAVACAFSAICYADFASRIPVAGSAYTYAYASFGELFAWIIGWDLIMEYAIGNIAVAISWSDYFSGLLGGYGIHIPSYFKMDFLSASRAFDQVNELLTKGQSLAEIGKTASASIMEGYQAWITAPKFLGIHVIANLPALAITVFITWLVYIGIQETKRASNAMVGLKLIVILLVIVAGAFYIHPSNWSPFLPHGITGVMKGVSAVFFAYIGFDAISTTAEECKDPQRDLPRGMIYSLIICTVLYILIALVLTGMVNYSKLQVGDPLAFVFGPEGVGLNWIAGIIAISAVIAMASVLLVFQLGQPRIWMSMSRDGLLPPIFSSIHPKYKTPWFSTIITGFVVALPALVMNLTEVTDLTSIGTLFAFVLVCGGVLRMDRGGPAKKGFRTPYLNSKWIAPVLFAGCFAAAWFFNHEGVTKFFSTQGGWDVFKHKIPMWFYLIGMTILAVLCFLRDFSLIPVLGLSTCGYLMTELGILNWARFGIWLVVGIVIYSFYGFKRSRLASS